MEISKKEVLHIQETVSQAASKDLMVLDELQLALIGGGNAAVDFG